MNVEKLMIILSFGFGGAEGRLLKIENSLRHSGSIACVNEDFLKLVPDRKDFNIMLAELKSSNRIIVIPSLPEVLSGMAFIKYAWVILYSAYILARFRPAICHLALGGLLMAPMCKIFGAKVIVELTSPDNVDFFSKYKILLAWAVDRYLCVSESVFKRKERKICLGKGEVYPIPYYERKSDEKSSDKKNFFTISYCARFIQRKNPVLFAKSIVELNDIRSDFKVAMLGSGECEEEVKSLLSSLIDEGRVFVGRVSYPFEVLSESDVFVSLIEPDNYPSQSVLEAMDAENALILSDTGDSANYIDGNGILVPLDESSIANTINDFMNGAYDLALYKTKSRELIDEFYSPHVITNYIEQLYASVLGRKC